MAAIPPFLTNPAARHQAVLSFCSAMGQTTEFAVGLQQPVIRAWGAYLEGEGILHRTSPAIAEHALFRTLTGYVEQLTPEDPRTTELYCIGVATSWLLGGIAINAKVAATLPSVAALLPHRPHNMPLREGLLAAALWLGGSQGAAARFLGINQSTFSHRIAQTAEGPLADPALKKHLTHVALAPLTYTDLRISLEALAISLGSQTVAIWGSFKKQRQIRYQVAAQAPSQFNGIKKCFLLTFVRDAQGHWQLVEHKGESWARVYRCIAEMETPAVERTPRRTPRHPRRSSFPIARQIQPQYPENRPFHMFPQTVTGALLSEAAISFGPDVRALYLFVYSDSHERMVPFEVGTILPAALSAGHAYVRYVSNDEGAGWTVREVCGNSRRIGYPLLELLTALDRPDEGSAVLPHLFRLPLPITRYGDITHAHCTDWAHELGVNDRFYIRFVPNTDGSIRSVTISRGLSPGSQGFVFLELRSCDARHWKIAGQCGPAGKRAIAALRQANTLEIPENVRGIVESIRTTQTTYALTQLPAATLSAIALRWGVRRLVLNGNLYDALPRDLIAVTDRQPAGAGAHRYWITVEQLEDGRWEVQSANGLEARAALELLAKNAAFIVPTTMLEHTRRYRTYAAAALRPKLQLDEITGETLTAWAAEIGSPDVLALWGQFTRGQHRYFAVGATPPDKRNLSYYLIIARWNTSAREWSITPSEADGVNHRQAMGILGNNEGITVRE